MTCARCGNALHRLPMFDLPRKVREFSCLCCGERFWTTQGEANLKSDGQVRATNQAVNGTPSDFAPSVSRN